MTAYEFRQACQAQMAEALKGSLTIIIMQAQSRNSKLLQAIIFLQGPGPLTFLPYLQQQDPLCLAADLTKMPSFAPVSGHAMA